jgi:hypothetical protein
MIVAQSPRTPLDSFTPVVLATTLAPVLHVGTKVPIRVKVTADASVLDIRDSPLKVEVALASECEGTFAATQMIGLALMNRPLSPQPAAGRAYSATAATTWNAPKHTGTQTVCVWLVQESDQRVFASDQSLTVQVAKALPKPRKPPVRKKTKR